MTREEMLIELRSGSRITHRYFDDEEFIFMQDGIIYDESGHTWGDESCEGMTLRTGGFWDDGWDVFKK